VALIVDPDLLIRNTELVIHTGTKRIQLVVAGNLTSDGALFQAVYSALMREWETDPTLSAIAPYIFPLDPVDADSYFLQGGWDWHDNTTRKLLRSGGWTLIDTSNNVQEVWSCVISLGAIAGADQGYYQQDAALATVNFDRTGPINEAIQVFGDATHGNFDRRSFLRLFVREQAKTYPTANLTDIGVTQLTANSYSFALANAADARITVPDATIDSTAPYTGMSITWYGTDQARPTAAGSKNFRVIVDANGGTAAQVYNWMQRQLRRNVDIDAGAGSQIGNVTDRPMRYVGDILTTSLMTEGGVYIDNLAAADQNVVQVTDNTGATFELPHYTALVLNFGPLLQADPDARFYVWFTNDDAGDNTGRDFGTSTAIQLRDYQNNLVEGDCTVPSRTFLIAYDTNAQRGAASAGTNMPLTVVFLGKNTAQYGTVSVTLNRDNVVSVVLAAQQENNYTATGTSGYSKEGDDRHLHANTGVTTFDGKLEYSRWKDWVLTGDNSKYLQAFATVGGDDIGGGNRALPYFFIINGWVVHLDDANYEMTVTSAVLGPAGAALPVSYRAGRQQSVRYNAPLSGIQVGGNLSDTAIDKSLDGITDLSGVDVLRLLLAHAAGKLNIEDLGGGLFRYSYRNLADTKTRLQGTVRDSDGDRTTVTAIDVS
jgi:hypothetical protein